MRSTTHGAPTLANTPYKGNRDTSITSMGSRSTESEGVFFHQRSGSQRGTEEMAEAGTKEGEDALAISQVRSSDRACFERASTEWTRRAADIVLSLIGFKAMLMSVAVAPTDAKIGTLLGARS
jgi:hypothetical protein